MTAITKTTPEVEMSPEELAEMFPGVFTLGGSTPETPPKSIIYKIRRNSDGLFSMGGSTPGFNKTGKIWKQRGHLGWFNSWF